LEEEVSVTGQGEAWRPVPACRWYGIPAGVFEGSSLGRVKVGGVVREGSPDRDGYLRVKHRGRWWYVHVLVCLAFHGGPQVRHLGDGVTDNKPAKLVWGSKRQNEKDKRDKKEKGSGGYPPVPGVTAVTGGLR
jgi:hypothetical protein